MKAVIEIDVTTLQAKQLMSYIETLPFIKIKTNNEKVKSLWNEAIAEGAVSLDEFDLRFQNEIYKYYHT